MAMRKITPVGRPIGRTRPGAPLQMAAKKAAALVAVGRARYWTEPTPEPPKQTRTRRRSEPNPKPDPVIEAAETVPESEPEATAAEPEETAEAEPEEEAEPGIPIAKSTGMPDRRYLRRDMTAED